MAATVELWTPPDGMNTVHVASWRAFYRKALDNYGLTPAEYLAYYIAQKGRCAICQVVTGIHPQDPKARGRVRLGIDHHHGTGAVRGLLCTSGPGARVPGCNWIIGVRNAAALRRAADYLDGTRTPGLLMAQYKDAEMVRAELFAIPAAVPVVPGLKIIPSGHIVGVDYGPCFGGCTPSRPCRQTQGRHWYKNPANEYYVRTVEGL